MAPADGVWELMSPSGVVHVIRGDSGLRRLGKEEYLKYECLDLLVSAAKPPKHVKGWKLFPSQQATLAVWSSKTTIAAR